MFSMFLGQTKSTIVRKSYTGAYMNPANHAHSPDQYAQLYEDFRWHVPTEFNIADVCCHRWAQDGGRERIALICEDGSGSVERMSYAELHAQANRLSNLYAELEVPRFARVAIILPQRVEAAIAHMACYQSALVAMPMSILFGPDALEYRLQDSQATVAIVDAAALPNLEQIRARCPSLKHVLAIDCRGKNGSKKLLDWRESLADYESEFQPQKTKSTDPAILIYTSGTTGSPKGALLPHCALIGNLTGFVASQNWFPQEGDVFWSPADWAWTGGLMDALLPTLYFGKPIVGYRGRFSAETAFRLLEKHAVTNTFLFPTALKMMMKAEPHPTEKFNLNLRAIMSAGESVGEAVFAWCQKALGVTVNEMFGQTEMNYIVGNSADKWLAKPGSMGRPYPGHRVAIIDENGIEVAPGVTGEVALHRTDIHGTPDPIFFSEYLNNRAATSAKYTGDWCRTGDLASMDEDGYLWYQGRADDMFKAAGYRIGPSEIENCLVKHESVANVAVVPKPDAERGNLVKAFIVPTAGTPRDAESIARLIADLQDHVRGKLAPYEYPKEIEFVDELPMTTTGKIQRRVLRMLEETRCRKQPGRMD
jgi:acetyl-CoA synthetase